MRLTNSIRDGIIRAVLNDIPQTNYAEKEDKIIIAAARRGMPAPVRAVYDNPELRCRLERCYHKRASFSSCCVPGSDENLKFTKSEQAKISAYAKKEKDQREKVDAARRSLRETVYAYSTAKQLREAVPELARYIPVDETKIRNLPAKTDVIGKLKEAGLKLKSA